MANVVQRNFAGGEIGPDLYARTDQVKYATGLRTCRNFLVQKHGGVANRPGTVFVGAVKDASNRPRLLKFVFNDAQTYVLEAGAGYLRFFQAGGRVVVSGVAAWVTSTVYAVGDLVSNDGATYYCTTAHTSGATTEPGVGASAPGVWYALEDDILELPTPYAAADLATLKTVQSADIVTIVHPSYAPYELRREGAQTWVLQPVAIGPSLAGPSNLAVAGGVAGTNVSYAVTAVKDGTFDESLPSIKSAGSKKPDAGTPITLSWGAVVGALEYNVYRTDDGLSYGFIGTSGGTPLTASDTSWDTGSADVSQSGNGQATGAGQARNTLDVAAATNGHATDEFYTVVAELEARCTSDLDPNNDDVSANAQVYYSRDGEARVLAGTLGGLTAGGVQSFSKTIRVPDNGYTTLRIDLVPIVSVGDGEDWTVTVTGASVSWKSGKTGFTDPAIDPDFTLAPPTQQTLFASDDNFPSCAGYYQQRQLYANTNTDPERVWASRSGQFTNFSISTPLQDDDAVQFVMAGRQVNAVRHLLDLGGFLLVFTTAGVHVVQGDTAGILTPTAINPRQVAGIGIADALPPLVADNTALYVQARGTIVRAIRNDAVNGYEGNDLSVFAPHLFEFSTLVDWDYAETPQSIVWAVRSDGVLLGLTFLPEHQIWGWHRHDTDGVIEAVCTVPEGTEDRVYLAVKRTVDGSTVRYIERMASRSFEDVAAAIFLDAALSYDGRNTGATTMTLSGGTTWDEKETLTCTASAATFAAGDVGNAVHLTADDGTPVRCAIEAFASSTVVTVRAQRAVPADLQATATTSWALAKDAFSGLDHLEGKDVAVFADGFVVANPLRDCYPTVTVSGGEITLDRPYAVVHVGLPYLADLETLDIDTSQGPSFKDRAMKVTAVGLWVKQSRGIWVGRALPDDATPTDGLEERKPRDTEALDDPPALVTDCIEVAIDSGWDSNGRIAVRQVDPLPLTVLAAIPQGFLPRTG